MDGYISKALAGAADRRGGTPGAAGNRSVESLERLLNGIPHSVLVKDRAHRLLLVNDAMCALIGRPREELLGRTDHDFLPAEQASGYQAVDNEVFATGEEREVEEELTAADGTVHVLRTRKCLVTLPSPDGEESFIIASVSDITESRRTERALRENEERFRRTVELSPLIPWLADPGGMILDADARWYARTGLTPEQTLGTGWTAVLHPDDLPQVIRLWSHSIGTGEPFSVEYRYRQQDGSYRWIHARATAQQDSQGRIIRWYGTLEDIHDRKLAEIALRGSEERHRYTLELSPLIPWSADAQGMISEIGSRWCDRTGMTAEETLGTGFAAALHPEDAAEAVGTWRRSVATGEPLSVECRYRLADGRYRWIHVRAAPLRDADGHITRWYGTLEDIQDRKLAEEALRESEMRFRAMADDAPVIIWVTDPTGGATFLSRLWYDVTGMNPGDDLYVDWLNAIHPEDRHGVEQAFLAANARQEPLGIEYRLRRANGTFSWVIDQGRPRFAADGSFLGYVGSVTDITERREMEAALRESEAFARSVLESGPNCVRVLDLEGRLLFMNEAGHRLLETEGDGKSADSWAATLPAQYVEEARLALASARAGHTSRHHGHRITRKGEVQWLDVTIAPIPGADGRPARLLSIWHDVTEVREAREAAERAKRAAEASAARLSAVLESTMDSVIVLDADWRLTYLNENARRLLQARKLHLGISIWEVFPEEVDGVFARNYRRAVTQQIPVSFEEFLPALDAWLEVQAYPTAEGLSVFFRDITERRRAEQERLLAQEKLAHMARHDVLTGLPNRVLFRERLERVLAEGAGPMAVLYLDLDGFKAVNDTLGHPAGDTLLREVAERLQSCVRGCDLVARLGGDEFAIVQGAVSERADARALAHRIVELLGEPFTLSGQLVVIGASVGVAMAPKDGSSADDLLKAADIALYNAKAEGRGTYSFFDPSMDSHLQARHAIQLALHGALARGEFELRYQPLVDLGTNRVSSFEALLRWTHPERGMISPADFIPVAEETGLIVQIGEWALREACRTAAGWPEQVSVAVNLSPVQFRSKTLIGAVRNALRVSGLAPGRLYLEITESVLLQDNTANLECLQELRRLGVRIAMDDFGTGYSSLGYLRSFSFDKIKLDRSFVRDLPNAMECQAILRAVAGLASGLGIATTAEGIETDEQLVVVRASGYKEGQGYLFGKPISAAETHSVVEQYRAE